ncbi:MAG: PAS domain S-box protein [Deltaproteobacteria bacterium]|nr:PAS domain S-box protein [Deltaproteobacteria bacterium]
MDAAVARQPDTNSPRPIRFWLPLILGVAGFAGLVGFTVFDLDQTVRRVEERARADVAVKMSNLQGAITFRLRQQDMPGVQNVIANQGFHEYSKHVLFIDKQEKIIAATRLALLGQPLASAVPELGGQLAGCKGNRWRGVIQISADRTSLFACYPAAFPNDVSDLAREATGYILSTHDLSRPKNTAKAEASRRLVLVWLLFGAGFCALLFFLRHALARQRIGKIVGTTAALAAGNLEARVGLTGRDELASIGQAMDSMAARLQAAARALNESRDQMELRVEERTAELKKANKHLEREIAARLQSEQSLRESEERYRRLIDLSPDAAFVSLSGTIVYVNAAMVCLLAAADDHALLGRSLFDLLHPDCHETVRGRMRQLSQTGQQNPPLLQKWLRFDGAIAEVEAAAARIPWAEGRANLVMLRDVSEVQKREAWLQGLIETTQDAVISIDREARVVMFNPAAEKIFGYSKAEVEGQKVNMLMGEPYASEHDAYITRYKRTGEARAIGKTRTVVGRRKGGEDFPIELSVT